MEYSGAIELFSFILKEWKSILLFTIIFFLYFYYTSEFNYFKKKNVKYMKPKLFIGNLGPRIFRKVSFHVYQYNIYNYFKGYPYGGIFQGRTPVLYIFDKDLIKAITIRDFDYFVDRNNVINSGPEYLTQSLLNLKGSEWKRVRSLLTPAFSSSRLKGMLPLIQHCSNQMVNFLKQYEKSDIKMKDVMGHFTLEVIGACAFGIKCEALSDENSQFIKLAKKFNYNSRLKSILILTIFVIFPKLLRILKLTFFNTEATDKLVNMLVATKAERRSSKLKRNDFLQLLIDAAEKERNNENGTFQSCLDNDTIDAQSLLFLIAGYETSSTLLSFAIYELATKPELQNKLRAHIEESTNGKEINYELVSQLYYLEGFLLETLRMYPPISRIDRICTKKYTLPGTTVHLDVGDMISIPIIGIHMDPDIYPEPQIFRPERFIGEEKINRPSHLFLAFGVGPRNCIGLRFAMLSTKFAMISLLKNFKFSVCDKTQVPIQFDKKDMLLKSESGIWLHIEPL